METNEKPIPGSQETPTSQDELGQTFEIGANNLENLPKEEGEENKTPKGTATDRLWKAQLT